MRKTITTAKKDLIPQAPVGRILFKVGAERVSAEAIDAFTEIVTDIAIEIGQKAVRIAQHSGRKTVQDSDVKLAVKQ